MRVDAKATFEALQKHGILVDDGFGGKWDIVKVREDGKAVVKEVGGNRVYLLALTRVYPVAPPHPSLAWSVEVRFDAVTGENLEDLQVDYNGKRWANWIGVPPHIYRELGWR